MTDTLYTGYYEVATLDPKSITYLVKPQKGQCAWCKQYLTPSEIIEVDHLKPTRQGGNTMITCKHFIIMVMTARLEPKGCEAII